MIKRIVLISIIGLFLSAGWAFSQQTTAPDQDLGATNIESVSVTVSTNSNSMSTNLNTVASDSNTNVIANETNTTIETNIAVEREVVPAEGNVYNDGKMDFVSSNVKFDIKAKDEGAGIKSISIMVDDSQFGDFDKPIVATSEGNHILAYKIEDNVGNVSPLKFYQFILDRTAPTVNISSDKKVVKIGETIYCASNFLYSLKAMDNLSGVKSLKYILDDSYTNVFENPFDANGTNGFHKISYIAVDNVGNESELAVYNYFLDANAPVVSFVVNPVPYETNDIKYISANTFVKVEAKDSETSVAAILYSIDGDDFKDYTYAFKLSGGAHTIKAKAVDALGNISEEISLTVTVDASGPEGDLIPTK